MAYPALRSLLTASALTITLALSSGARADGKTPPSPTGHFSVRATCVERMATPEKGLRVLVDGIPKQSLGMDEVGDVFVDGEGLLRYGTTPIGYGFDAPPGRHVVRIEANDCGPMEQMVDVGIGTKIETTLPITNEAWLGAAGAPNGFTMGIFGFHTSVPHSISKDVHSNFAPPGASFDVDVASLDGVRLTGGYVHRNFVAHFDVNFGLTSATATGTHADGTKEAFDSKVIMLEDDARVGLRQPFGNLAFEAGSGFGYGLWAVGKAWSGGETSDFDRTSKFHIQFPVWASLIAKPTCDVGFALDAAYRFDPLHPEDSTTMFGAGLVWEPNSACSNEPSFVAT
jgi:hypothetical protein